MKNKTTKTKAKKQSPLANARPRDAVIREANRRLDKIEKAREVLTDQEKIIKATLVKGELGMKVGHFMAARKLRTMDGGERHSLLVAIREQFTAMKDTDKKQVNFLEVMEQEDKRALEDLNQKLNQTEEAAFEQGKEAGLSQASMTDNPYPPKSKHYIAWDNGYKAGLLELVEKWQGSKPQAAAA